MPLHTPTMRAAMLLIVLGSQQGCDFRQITEDRPLKLPAESTEPKETHPVETSQQPDRANPARSQ